ncbi:MAG: Ig-like domain-containing protein, partial [Spirochaetaceae bacterium]|nr:Ig-like domain-containing protein [Spirochaetaceae bacterium]
MEKTVRKDRTGKTRGLLPGFYLLSLIFCLAAACENAAEPVVTVVTVGGNEDEDLAEEGTPPEPPEENPDPPHIGGGAGEYPGVKVKSVALDETEIELAAGGTYQLTATVDPPEAPVTWFSRKAGAVSVDGTGLVTRQGWGMAEVVAKAGGKSAVCVVTAGPKSAGLYQIVSETEEDEIDV